MAIFISVFNYNNNGETALWYEMTKILEKKEHRNVNILRIINIGKPRTSNRAIKQK